ncbi:hypothetical protein MMC12_001446 [Toensbergia leucococca]|nr:hypothetical protein [Toensbergia leucococca]
MCYGRTNKTIASLIFRGPRSPYPFYENLSSVTLPVLDDPCTITNYLSPVRPQQQTMEAQKSKEDDTDGFTINRQSPRRLLILTITTIFLFSAFITTFLTTFLQPTSRLCSTPPSTSPFPIPSPPRSCGNTTQSARLQNCTFDPISFSWLPAPCTDTHLTAAFLAKRPWQWYLDRAGTQPAPRSEVLRGDHDNLYVTAEYHILHCTYMWRKMHRAVAAGWLIDGYVGRFEHTAHCEAMILEGLEGKERVVDTVIRMKWPECPMVW